MSKKKILITGCCGFIGRNLTKHCLESGYDVVGLDDYSTAYLRNFDVGMLKHITFVNWDMTTFRKPLKFIRRLNECEVVFHLAAKARVQPSIDNVNLYHDTNVNGTLALLEWMKNVGLNNLIFASSSSVYGDMGKVKFKEDDSLLPTSPYAIQKKIAEDYIRYYQLAHGIQGKILRYFNVFGDGMILEGKYVQAVQKFLGLYSEDKPFEIFGDGLQMRDFTHVDDVVNANMLAMDYEVGDTFNIGAGVPYSILDVCKMIGGENYPIEYYPAKSEPSYTCANNEKAKNILKWTPTKTLPEWINEKVQIIQSYK